MGAPPTLIDAPAPARRRPAPRKRSRAPLVAGLVAAAVAALGIAGFAFYWVVLHYDPVAHRHVPAGSSFAIRFDLEQIALFGPVRRNLLPLANEPSAPAAGANAPSTKPLGERIEDATGIHLSRDLRELIAVNVGPTDSGRWALLVGGKIPSGFVRGLAKVAQEEGAVWDLSPSGDVLARRGGGMALGQASDGTLVLASDTTTLAAALPDQANDQAIGLPETGAVGFAVAASAFHEWGSGMASAVLASLRTLDKIDGCNGRFLIDGNPRLDAQCRVAAGVDPNEIRTSMLGVVTDLRRLSELGGGTDLMGERQALADAQVVATADGRVRLTAPWPLEGLERGARSLAGKIRTLRDTLGAPPPPPAATLFPGIPGLPGIQLVPPPK